MPLIAEARRLDEDAAAAAPNDDGPRKISHASLMPGARPPMPIPPPWSHRSSLTGKRRGTPRPRRWLRRGLWALPGAALALTVLPLMFLAVLPPPSSAFMVHQWARNVAAGDGRLPAYRWAPAERISPQLALAVIAAEDQRFPTHFGLDLTAIRRAADHNARGGPTRGASTITQQTVKNLFLWPGRSWLRKGLEAWLAVWMELLLPKARILELYLNVAQFGPNVYGAEAASRLYFGVSAHRLDARQAALLAAVLPNPVRYRVDAPTDHVRRRQAWILMQMRHLGPEPLRAVLPR